MITISPAPFEPQFSTVCALRNANDSLLEAKYLSWFGIRSTSTYTSWESAAFTADPMLFQMILGSFSNSGKTICVKWQKEEFVFEHVSMIGLFSMFSISIGEESEKKECLSVKIGEGEVLLEKTFGSGKFVALSETSRFTWSNGNRARFIKIRKRMSIHKNAIHRKDIAKLISH